MSAELLALEALKLADATLRGANMDRAFVERKVSAAIDRLSSGRIGLDADTIDLLHAMLASYAGQPSCAGDAFKIVDAALSDHNDIQAGGGEG